MKNRPFKDHHLLLLLQGYAQQQLPLDLYISHYFRAHKALGSKDRGYIAETIYSLVRWQGLLDYLCKSTPTWEKRLEFFQQENFSQLAQSQDIPPHIKVSFPKPLFDLIEKSYGLAKASELCLINNEAAPTTVRINPLKTTRQAMLDLWKDKYDISACKSSEYGIVFHTKINFFGLPEFQKGLFEVQDEGSQLVSNLVQVNPGDHVLDYCAGSGGKTLAFAPLMKSKGQIFVHDIRPHALIEARKRLKRAGIQNFQIVEATDEARLKKLKKRMDWILVDAPCTGTGTMRRNPDMKWRFTEEMVVRLTGQQRMIFEKALSFLKPEGRIVYVTCSILNEENEAQIDHFTKTYDLVVEGEIFKTLPSPGGMDGFFGVVLKRRQP